MLSGAVGSPAFTASPRPGLGISPISALYCQSFEKRANLEYKLLGQHFTPTGHLTYSAGFATILDDVDVLLKTSFEYPQISAAWTPLGCAVGAGAVTRGAHRYKPGPAFFNRLLISGKRIGRRHLRLGVHQTLRYEPRIERQTTHNHHNYRCHSNCTPHRHALVFLSTTNQGTHDKSYVPWHPYFTSPFQNDV